MSKLVLHQCAFCQRKILDEAELTDGKVLVPAYCVLCLKMNAELELFVEHVGDMETADRSNQFYKVVSRKRKNVSGFLEGIKPYKRFIPNNDHSAYIEVAWWSNWKCSRWVRLKQGNKELVFDSGVIEELAEVLKSTRNQPVANGEKK